jgi:acetyl esterase/lipase
MTSYESIRANMGDMDLDPEIARVLGPGPTQSLGDLSVEELPQYSEQRRYVKPPALSEAVSRSDYVISEDPLVAVRVHRPKALSGLLPCLYSIHGGSFVLGSNLMDDALLDAWCPEVGCVAVSVDYRLAPETPYPGPLEDCYAGLVWLHENASSLGVDPARIGVVGVSAGGALAAGLVLLARERGGPSVAFQLLDSPCLDDRQATASSQWSVPIANRATIRLGWEAYLGELYGTREVPQFAAPALDTDLSGLPPSFLSVGALDGLRDEVVDFASRLHHSGVATELHVYEGAPHNFASVAPMARVSLACRADQLQWLRRQTQEGS